MITTLTGPLTTLKAVSLLGRTATLTFSGYSSKHEAGELTGYVESLQATGVTVRYGNHKRVVPLRAITKATYHSE